MWADRRILLAALGLSLLLNLFMGATIVGRLVGPHAGSSSLWPVGGLRLVGSGERAQFRAVMAAYQPALREAHKAVLRARAQVKADVASPAYDETRVTADLAGLREAAAAQQAVLHTAAAHALARLSAASRAKLVAHSGA